MVSALKPPGYEDAQKVIHSDGLCKKAWSHFFRRCSCLSVFVKQIIFPMNFFPFFFLYKMFEQPICALKHFVLYREHSDKRKNKIKMFF